MNKLHVRQIILRKWFPPDDRFASCVARLCILREDFYLELAGVQTASIREFDGLSVPWRKMYFWRSLVRTLGEIRQTVDTLNTIREFKAAVEAQSPAWKNEYKTLIGKLAREKAIVKKIRDSLGGHVLQQTVQEALNNMAGDVFSYVEFGSTARKTHYRFSNEIVVEMLVPGIPEPEKQAAIEKHFNTISDLLPAFHLATMIFDLYVKVRRLLR
jgi:hypothetical protein